MIGRRIAYFKKQSGGDENTLLLLHANDLNDSSIYGRIITNHNNLSLTTEHKFGTSSFNCAVSGKYLSFPFIDLTETDFTIDWWEYDLGTSLSGTSAVLGTLSSSKASVVIDKESSYRHMFQVADTTANNDWYVRLSSSVQNSVWNHWACIRENLTAFKMYLNGALIGSTTYTGAIYKDTSDMSINSWRGNSYPCNSYIDEFRISNVARWTSDFTPPTEPYSK